jgi:F-box-like
MSHRSQYDVLKPENTIKSKISRTKVLSPLKSEMYRQKQRLCPIMKLKSDELMIIFEMSREEDWTSPLYVAAVCRRWRDLILITPKAWRTLRLPTRPPLNIISLYISHSRPFLLHLSTPNVSSNHPSWTWRYGDVINQISKRIECLQISAEELDLLTSPFPRLRRLYLDTSTSPCRLSSLPQSRFPSLSQMKALRFEWRDSSTIINPPPIQVLFLRADDQRTWLKVLAILKDTLVSLRIIASSPGDRTMIEESLDFPRLKYLEVFPDHLRSRWRFKAKTLSLRSYSTCGADPFKANFSVEVDFAVITHLHLWAPTDPSLYPKVRHLRLLFPPDEIVEMIEFNFELCPPLESIEYYTWNIADPKRTSFERKIQGKVRCVEVIPCTVYPAWEVPLPFQYPQSVSTSLVPEHAC